MWRHVVVLTSLIVAVTGCGPTMAEPEADPVQTDKPAAASDTGSTDQTEVAGDSDSVPDISTTVASTTGYAIRLDDAPVRLSPSGKAEVHMLARGEEAFVAILDMEPGAAVPENTDPTEEYIYVLEGGGTMTMDGESFEISAGMLVFMPPGVTVSFQNGDAPMRALQIFADPDPAAKYDAWTSLPENSPEANP